MNEYEKQANKFLKETDTEFKTEFLKNGLYFDDDKGWVCSDSKKPRDIYLITLKRGNREYKFKFGQSINDSNGKTNPTSYDVLTSLQKYEIEDFKDFCDSFGYDEDSRKAERIYKAVLDEYQNLKMLYSDAELEKMQEIQ